MTRVRKEKLQICLCFRDQQKAYRMAQASAEKLAGPAEKETVATERAVGNTPEPILPKGKGTKLFVLAPGREVRESS